MAQNDIDYLVKNLSKSNIPRVNLWKKRSIGQLKNYEKNLGQMLAFQIYTKKPKYNHSILSPLRNKAVKATEPPEQIEVTSYVERPNFNASSMFQEEDNDANYFGGLHLDSDTELHDPENNQKNIKEMRTAIINDDKLITEYGLVMSRNLDEPTFQHQFIAESKTVTQAKKCQNLM